MTRILIDGYNLLPQTDFKDRDQLIRALSRYRKEKRHEITVVFDGTAKGTFYGDRYQEAGIEIHFSPITVTADDVIEEILEQGSRSGWIVVSSDRRIQSAARKAQASVVSSQEFAKRIRPRPGGGSSLSGEVPPWMEGRTDEEDGRRTKKKGPSKRLSKEERKRRQTMKKL